MITRLARFTAAMYKPHYLIYAVLWVLAVEGLAAVATGVGWRPGAATVVRIVVAAVVLLYLRMVDEQKDLDYDRNAHPDRPLVTGAVTARDLRVGMAVIALMALIASAFLSVASGVLIAAVLGYGLALWAAEERSPWLRASILANLALTYPIQLILYAYVVISAHDTGQVGRGAAVVWPAFVFAGAFLYFEFARKTSARPRPGEAYYSNVLGAVGSCGAGLGCAALGVIVAVLFLAPWTHSGVAAAFGWLPLLLFVIPLALAVRFLRGRTGDHPVVPAVLFVLLFYVDLVVAASVIGS